MQWHARSWLFDSLTLSAGCQERMTDLGARGAVVVGAGSGLGRDIACALAERGARVMLAGRTRANLEETLRMLRAVSGADAVVAPTDVSDRGDVDRLKSTTERQFGRADILINCAGIFGPLRRVTQSDPDE